MSPAKLEELGPSQLGSGICVPDPLGCGVRNVTVSGEALPRIPPGGIWELHPCLCRAPAVGASSGVGTGLWAEGPGGTWSRMCHTPSLPFPPQRGLAAGKNVGSQNRVPVPASQVTPACVPTRTLAPNASPSAGRRGSPAPGSAPGPAPCDSESARAPTVAGGMSGKSFPLSSRSEAGRRVGSPLHTPSLQGQHHSLWVHLNLQTWGL